MKAYPAIPIARPVGLAKSLALGSLKQTPSCHPRVELIMPLLVGNDRSQVLSQATLG